MKRAALEVLRCPACRSTLTAEVQREEGAEIRSGSLRCSGCRASYPIVDSVPRFVDSDSYTEAFSFEWNVHRTTQVDSQTGRKDSEVRFAQNLPFPAEQLKDKWVLDVGCGTGRFAEIALKHGANVVGVDLSLA